MNFNRILLSMGVGALLLHASCESKHAHHEEDATFQVTSPIQKDTVVYRDYVSQIRSSQHIELRALEKGYLQNIYVDEGQFVKKGQLMFRIMPVIYQSEMEIAKAEANFAEIEYLNTKSLADSNVVSQNELALAKAKLTRAKAELSLAEAHLGFTEIRAPFDGIMGRFNDVRQGSLLDEGELLTTLSDNTKMWVYFNVPEAEYLDLVSSASLDSLPKVHLLMANHQRFADTGVIEAIESDFNNETGNIAFRATFQNANRILRHGETGNIQMPVPHHNALIIPQKATFEILDKKFVFVVGEDGVVQSRQITVLTELPHLYIISEGLSANEKILIEGLRKVENNQKIKVEFVNPEKVISELNSLHAE
ncbi:efflux RND transporter periplasmic adaptor subunit [Algoriphagus aestuariicola]|jgi:membrane fusion protein (multidrug efflux system)|uniref:Efflux RND transporter periplasmic adaptor subunit n=1 Tax=Algoriphagus aestuariicola TaxID=1852016 RepID=A0ABS3BQG8_9BACT|nr:efflux RND transporter periplasmic adaptor subunit [Algoriphagus aestuariicola]MBN7801528.1 efflux RND transporter periplasmic adaptor subunit [Algoriphagus aestuariicola]